MGSIAEGQEWKVDARNFIELLDPTLRGVPSGEIVIKRQADESRSGKQYAIPEIMSGYCKIIGSDDSKRRIGSFEPHGKLDYNIADGFIESASLEGRADFEELSEDHILFESRFRVKPTLTVNYKCTKR